jgi:Amt family ammonium transporter
MSVIGTGLLWVGWFGFNAGSALAAGASAGYAMLVTNAAAGTAAVMWILLELLYRKKASVQGALSGAVAGLVAITPAAGFVDFPAALIIGLAGGAGCYGAVTFLKHRVHLGDALDVFAIHGAGGIIGALLTGIFANPAIGPASGLLAGNPSQFGAQVVSIIIVAAWSAAATFALLLIVRRVTGLRVAPRVEISGLDLALHGETVAADITPAPAAARTA